jgi:integrase
VRTRVAGPTTLRRVHACLRASLNAAVRSRRLAYNPALGVELPAVPKQQVRPWEPHELGAFLDHVQAHRLGALFEVLAACGLRRGEALGLAWKDINFLEGTLTIRRQLLNAWADGAPVFGEPKTATGRRVVELDSRTLGTLIAHRLSQDTERASWGEGYEDHDLVFAQENGRPLDPSHVTKLFGRLTAEAGLRRVRLHDLRHGSASLMLAAGIPVEVVSKRLGHSSISVTTDIYSHLLEGVGRRAAEAAMGLVPRTPRATTQTSSDHMVTTIGPEDADGSALDS